MGKSLQEPVCKEQLELLDIIHITLFAVKSAHLATNSNGSCSSICWRESGCSCRCDGCILVRCTLSEVHHMPHIMNAKDNVRSTCRKYDYADCQCS